MGLLGVHKAAQPGRPSAGSNVGNGDLFTTDAPRYDLNMSLHNQPDIRQNFTRRAQQARDLISLNTCFGAEIVQRICG